MFALTGFLFLFLMLNQVLNAQPPGDGDLDTDFDSDGILTVDFGGNDRATFVVIQKINGLEKILVGGYTNVNGNNDACITCLNPDGTLDKAFGDNGKLIFPVSEDEDDEIRGLALQDNKIVAVGEVRIDGQNDMFVFRLFPDGSPDTTFSFDGVATTDVTTGEHDVAMEVGIHGDKIIIAGWTGSEPEDRDVMLLKYKNDGTKDVAFGNNGIVTADIHGAEDRAMALDIYPESGKILIGGRTFNVLSMDMLLMRFLPNGTPDKSFGGGGVVEWNVESDNDYINSVLIQPNGYILAAGDFINPNDNDNSDIAVSRFQPDGTPDNGFGTAGIFQSFIGADDDYGAFITKDQNGNVIFSAAVRQNSGEFDFSVIRLDQDGSLDISFANGGTGIYEVSELADLAACHAMQSDGKIVVVGRAEVDGQNDFAIIRINSCIPPKPTAVTEAYFEIDVEVYPNPASEVIYVKVPEGEAEISRVQVVDLMGRVWIDLSPASSMNGEELKVDVSGLPAGVYFVRIETSFTPPITKKFNKS